MKKYEGLVVAVNNELAESVYAASGVIDYDNDPECWTLSVSKDQGENEWATFRLQANHPDNLVHISTQTKVVLVFSQTITAAEFEGNPVSIDGNTVTLIRALHGNSYNSADQYNSMCRVYCENGKTVTCISSAIYCTHATNVQGGID